MTAAALEPAARRLWLGRAFLATLAATVLAHGGASTVELDFAALAFAFLALLATAATPALWSHCAAVSPFCSADGLYASGSDTIRSFLRRLDALGTVDDWLGPRDLERLAGRITARLLIARGTADEKIPASEPRRIVAALKGAGRRDGADFVYREISGGHDLIGGVPAAGLSQQLVRFLSGRGATQ